MQEVQVNVQVVLVAVVVKMITHHMVAAGVVLVILHIVSVMVQIVLELMAFKLLMEHLKWLRYLRINKKTFNLERF